MGKFLKSVRGAAVAAVVGLGAIGGVSAVTSGGSSPTVQPATPAKQCVVPKGKGELGACAPQSSISHILTRAIAPVATTAASHSVQICDLSNNDPVFGSAWAHVTSTGCYLKLNESTGFVDQTAARMVHDAREFHPGILLGGYDFQHICGASATAEADLFAGRETALGLNGANTLMPMGDVEFGSCPSQAAAVAWENAWNHEVKRKLGRVGEYTGQWFWGPHFPCGYFPGDDDWISGYTFLQNVPRLCGHSTIDLWQYTDKGWNGASTSDMSVWLDSPAAFAKFAAAPPRIDPFRFYPKTRFTFHLKQGGTVKASEYGTTSTYRKNHCSKPERRKICTSSLFHAKLLYGRDVFVVSHHLVRGHWVTLKHPRYSYPSKSIPLGSRLSGLRKIVFTQTELHVCVSVSTCAPKKKPARK